MVVNFQGLDKYGSKHTGSRTIIQANIGGKNGKMRNNVDNFKDDSYNYFR